MSDSNKPRFTAEQMKVIESRGKNLLVSAAAGSGKTAVLVERIIQKILDKENPMDIDRLLVVTFTEAAASEMRERIGKAIESALEKNPTDAHLQKQSALLYKAQISTIHSFCMNLIRNNFNVIGLDPNFRVADENELKLLMEDNLDTLFEEKYECRDEKFLLLVDYFLKNCSDSVLGEAVLSLFNFSEGYPYPDEWLDECKKQYKVNSLEDFEESVYVKFVLEYMKAKVNDLACEIESARAIVTVPGGPSQYEETIDKDIACLNELNDATTYGHVRDILDSFKWPTIAKKKADDDQEIVEWFQKKRDKYKKIITGDDKASIKKLFSEPIESEINKLNIISDVIENVIELTKEFAKRFQNSKQEKGIISFSDMEKYSLRILYLTDENGEHIPSPTALEYRDMYDELMMDEYQDCNRIQELLISAISNANDGFGNRFMVGDVKQSIYKFRLANPEIFIEKYKCYKCNDQESQSTLWYDINQRIDLHKNFRSRRNVVNSVNDLFGQIMNESVGGVKYDEDARLVYGASFPDDLPNENDVYDSQPNQDYDTEILLTINDSNGDLSKGESEAMLIANKIKSLKKTLKVVDKDTNKLRALRYSDIVILVRSMSDTAEGIKKIFATEGIPVHMSMNSGFYDTREIQTLIQLLKVIDNPRQDISLYGTMTSYFGNFTEEDIANIRVQARDVVMNQKENEDVITATANKIRCLYDSLIAVKDQNQKVSDFIAFVENWRRRAIYSPIHQLILELILETGFADYINALPSGDVRSSNLLLLIEQAKAFEGTNYRGLFNFVRYIGKIKKINNDIGEADVLDENANVVRVMTIHKSKGLEFPVCFLAGVHKQFNMRDTAGSIVTDMDFGIGISYIDVLRRVKNDPLYRKAINLKIKRDTLGEEIRILYVALTRAKEKMIITGVIKDEEEFESLAAKKASNNRVSYASIMDAKNYLDLLVPLYDLAKLVDYEDNMLGIEETFDKLVAKGELRKAVEDSSLANKEESELIERIELEYAHKQLEGMILKTSVSELKKAYMDVVNTKEMFESEDAYDKYIPKFAAEVESTISGTDRGSAYHKVMELTDFNSENIKTQINLWIEKGLMSEEWAKAVSIRKIENMLNSNLGQRMRKALENSALKREQPFVLGIDAKRVNEHYPEGENLLLQGIIDAFFVEDGEIVLVDYKTDVIKNGAELLNKYAVQLDYYTEALERITGMHVKESMLYSFALEEEIPYSK